MIETEKLFKERMTRCKFYFPDIFTEKSKVVHKCMKQNKECNTDICDVCKLFQSKFIEYPITVSKINQNEFLDLYKKKVGSKVELTLCEKGHENKKYTGILLGELPVQTAVHYYQQSQELNVSMVGNPAIWVEELNRIVYGYECWWYITELKESEEQKNEI